jgi:hypothetical protein
MTPLKKPTRIHEFTDFWSGLTGLLKMKLSSLVMSWSTGIETWAALP